MEFLKQLIREASLLLAFVVLGTLLLLSFWISKNVNQSLLREFKNDRVSVIVNEASLQTFRQFLNSDKNVVRYQIHDRQDNKQKLGELYPELKSVLAPLEDDYFPISATVSVKNGPAFIQKLQDKLKFQGAQLIHRPSTALKSFLEMATLVFSFLWIFALFIFLYFQLERLAFRESQTWSLVKMLGAKPFKIFWPLCAGQLTRIGFASIFACVLSLALAREFNGIFSWKWDTPGLGIWFSFVTISLFSAGIVFILMFVSRFRRVSLG